MLPIAGGNWNNGSNAGVFALNLNNSSGNNNNNNGCRAQRLQLILPSVCPQGGSPCRVEGKASVLGLLASNKRGRRFQ
jgi:RNA-directed DNA polymerase